MNESPIAWGVIAGLWGLSLLIFLIENDFIFRSYMIPILGAAIFTFGKMVYSLRKSKEDYDEKNN